MTVVWTTSRWVITAEYNPLLYGHSIGRPCLFRVCEIKHYYRPQRSWGKVIFSQASVILSIGGVPGQVHPPGPGTPPPRTRCTSPWKQCMPGDTGNKRAVRILLEYILVWNQFPVIRNGVKKIGIEHRLITKAREFFSVTFWITWKYMNIQYNFWNSTLPFRCFYIPIWSKLFPLLGTWV